MGNPGSCDPKNYVRKGVLATAGSRDLRETTSLLNFGGGVMEGEPHRASPRGLGL